MFLFKNNIKKGTGQNCITFEMNILEEVENYVTQEKMFKHASTDDAVSGFKEVVKATSDIFNRKKTPLT